MLLGWLFLALAFVGAAMVVVLFVYMAVWPKEDIKIYYCDDDCEVCKSFEQSVKG